MTSRLFTCSAGALAVVASLSLMAHGQAPITGVNWRSNLDAAKLEAAQTDRLVLLHFTTRTCGPCKMLDQSVFSQPDVAAALEKDYVPVRIDADASPALAARYRIKQVPTEFILAPDGTEVANPPIPDKPDAFTGQLQSFARHFRQSQGRPSTPGAATPDANAAYAGLPNAAAPPQAQGNPYMQQANPQVHGQAQSVYGAPMQQTAAPAANPPQQYAQQQPQQSQLQQQQLAAQQSPAMPANAMPQSYPSTEPMLQQNAAAKVAAATQVKAPQQSDLPPGSPALAFDGCCPVTLKTLNRWTYGNLQFGAVHRGRTYLFSGPQQREQFLASPDDYSPVFAGKDPVVLLDQQQSVDGSRKHGFRYGDAFYLFSSQETMDKFKASPQTYAAGVRQAMSQLDSAGDGVVRR